MRVITYKDRGYQKFVRSLDRRAEPSRELEEVVAGIVDEVRKRGDRALIDFTRKFDKAKLNAASLFVSEKEFAEAEAMVTPATKRAIRSSRRNIHAFAREGLRKDWKRKNAEGAVVGERFTPFDRVGIYVPGGKAPLVSTALMTGAFAQAAKVPEIVAATPVGPTGTVNPDLLYALMQSGATEVLKVGGAQAIAALAMGTKSVRRVDKIFGPGNAFVVEAKRQMVGAVSIDLLPGPSEVMVVSDSSGDPVCIAADLLAQAEHGGDSVVGFVTNSFRLQKQVEKEVARQLKQLSRAEYIEESLRKAGFVVLVRSIDDAIKICNEFAPEHLSLVVKDERRCLNEIRTAGAIYLGNTSAIAVGDFLAGPSHTLPTGGAGKSFSGLRPDQFQRRTSIVKMDKGSVKKSLPVVQEFARMEGLDAHGESVRLRVER
ncbi:MAG: histidinol dehydrogenase [Roseibacillus sp.]|nr:histidinol dehydrogenase [Roseibacillus sp.]|tara:strand:- start:5606 stop:6895 length:1290 start_codon:yes stop_codon:yes gene_type:complete